MVAIVRLATSVDAEGPALAADLGVTAYEARMLLAAGMPVVVRQLPDEPQARDLLARLRARGHDVLACDSEAVVSSSAMTVMRRPRVEADAVSLDPGPAGSGGPRSAQGPRLPFADILALVAAVHRRRTETSTSTVDTKFSAGRALVSGGVVMTREVKTTSRTAIEGRERVVYIFRKSGATPWILREFGTSWAGLAMPPEGESAPADSDPGRRPLARSESENFRTAVVTLRERAPGAAYDERLLSRKALLESVSSAGSAKNVSIHTSSEGGADLLAHLIALSVTGGLPAAKVPADSA